MNLALAFPFRFSAHPGAELVGVPLFGANIDPPWRRPNATRVLARNGTGIPEVYPFHAAAKALLRSLPQVGRISGTRPGMLSTTRNAHVCQPCALWPTDITSVRSRSRGLTVTALQATAGMHSPIRHMVAL